MRLLVIVLFASLISCSKQVPNEFVVYDNEFVRAKTNNMSGAILYNEKGQNLLGRYNRGGFTLNLSSLPKHNAVIIEAELLIHDSWDGNSKEGNIDGPDIWKMLADEKIVVNASFSNARCEPLYCVYQSYPANYGTVNNPPKTDAKQFFPGKCWNQKTGTTTMYRIIKTISHSSNKLSIGCMDELVQTNTDDPLCDESWSLSGLRVKTILVK